MNEVWEFPSYTNARLAHDSSEKTSPESSELDGMEIRLRKDDHRVRTIFKSYGGVQLTAQ